MFIVSGAVPAVPAAAAVPDAAAAAAADGNITDDDDVKQPLAAAVGGPPMLLPSEVSGADIAQMPRAAFVAKGQVEEGDIVSAMDYKDFPEWFENYNLLLAWDAKTGETSTEKRELLLAAFIRIKSHLDLLLEVDKDAELQAKIEAELDGAEVDGEFQGKLDKLLDEFEDDEFEKFVFLRGLSDAELRNQMFATYPDKWPVFPGEIIPGTDKVLELDDLNLDETRL